MKQLSFLVIIMLITGCGGGGGGNTPPATIELQSTEIQSSESQSTELQSIEISPAISEIPKGISLNFTATGYYSDNSFKDISENVLWSVSNETLAEISNASGSKGFLRSLSEGSITLKASLDDISSTEDITVSNATLDTLEVSSSAISFPLGLSTNLTAIGLYSDGSIHDITQDVTWESSDTNIAKINNTNDKGLLTGVAIDSFTATASLAVKSTPIVIAITGASLSRIEVTPNMSSIPMGTHIQYIATGIYSDSTTVNITDKVTWESSAPLVAAPDSSSTVPGLFAAYTEGSFTVSASLTDDEGSTSGAVTPATLNEIYINPSTDSIPKGISLQFSATGVFSDYSTKDITADVLWTTSDSSISRILNTEKGHGTFESTSAGTVQITATFMGISALADITISDEDLDNISISPLDSSLAIGTEIELSAEGTFSDGSTRDLTSQVLWTSSSATTAIVSNTDGSKGKLTGLSTGTADINVFFKNVTSSTSVTVTAVSLESIEIVVSDTVIPTGITRQFTATGTFTGGHTQDITKYVIWESSDKAIAFISNFSAAKGVLHAYSEGTADITAHIGGISSDPTEITIVGQALVTINITPLITTVEDGDTLTLSLEGTYQDSVTRDLTADAFWLSLNEDIASVSNSDGEEGTLTGLQAGTAIIAAVIGDKVLFRNVRVLKPFDSIEIQSSVISIPAGGSISFSAIVNYTGGGSEDITSLVFWESSDTDIATIFFNGQAQALSEGDTEISISVNGFEYDRITMSVNTDTIDTLIIASEITGGGIQFTAYGTTVGLPDGPYYDLTNLVTWESNDVSVLTISNEAGTKGFATAHGPGTCIITATLNIAISADRSVTLTP